MGGYKCNSSKIRRDVLIQSHEHGGLKAPDIYTNFHGFEDYKNKTMHYGKKLIMSELEKVGGLEYLLASN